jgi:hypothetical protein
MPVRIEYTEEYTIPKKYEYISTALHTALNTFRPAMAE